MENIRKIFFLVHSRNTLFRIRHTSARISAYRNVDTHNSAWRVLLRGGDTQDNKRISHPSVFNMGMGALQRADVALPVRSDHGRNASYGVMGCRPDRRNRPRVQRPCDANDYAGCAESLRQQAGILSRGGVLLILSSLRPESPTERGNVLSV